MKNAIVSLVCMVSIYLTNNVQAQRNCGTPAYEEILENRYPSYRIRQQQIEDLTLLREKNPLDLTRHTIKIPVVIHVIYHREVENISDEQILSQLEVLNEDYRRFNKDAIKTPGRFRKLAADTGIEFVLANLDPQGNPTTGITRTYTSNTIFAAFENEMKYNASGGIDAWPTHQYLNIWICPLGMGVLGYAQFPGGPIDTDGVVIDYKHFGTLGTVKPPFHLGRTTTHEVGHYLNLRHIWGDGPCDFDDAVDDTPLADGPSQGCPGESYSCGSHNMPQNYMDYTDDACMNLFTRGQAYRMRALFSPGGARESLLFSPAYINEEEESPTISLFPPSNLKIEQIQHHSAILTWDQIQDILSYDVRYRPTGHSRWKQKAFSQPYVKLVDLPACTSFEVQIASINDQEKSNYSDLQHFKTTGCFSEIPTRLIATHISSSQATLTWNKVLNADSYLIQYRRAGDKEIRTLEVDKYNSIKVRSLIPGTVYQFRVCAILDGEHRPFSRVRSFSTSSATSMASEEVEFMLIKKGIDQNDITVEINQMIPRTVAISLIDPLGNPISTFPVETWNSTRPITLDTSKLKEGTYEVVAEDKEGFEYSKSFNVAGSDKNN